MLYSTVTQYLTVTYYSVFLLFTYSSVLVFFLIHKHKISQRPKERSLACHMWLRSHWLKTQQDFFSSYCVYIFHLECCKHLHRLGFLENSSSLLDYFASCPSCMRRCLLMLEASVFDYFSEPVTHKYLHTSSYSDNNTYIQMQKTFCRL